VNAYILAATALVEDSMVIAQTLIKYYALKNEVMKASCASDEGICARVQHLGIPNLRIDEAAAYGEQNATLPISRLNGGLLRRRAPEGCYMVVASWEHYAGASMLILP
jgi:hypothetical protein